MEMYVLIKKNGNTKMITEQYINKRYCEKIKERIYSLLNYLNYKNGNNYMIDFQDIESLKNTGSIFDKETYKILHDLIYKNQKQQIINIFVNELRKKDYDLNENEEEFLKNIFSIIFESSMSSNCSFSYILKKEFNGFIKEELVQNICKEIEKNKIGLTIDQIILELEQLELNMNSDNIEKYLIELGEINLQNNGNNHRKHKCYNCKNLSPLTCKKAEFEKKNIKDYDFIIDGYQIYIETKKGDIYLDNFTVLKCRNVEIIKPSKEAKLNFYKVKTRKQKK